MNELTNRVRILEQWMRDQARRIFNLEAKVLRLEGQLALAGRGGGGGGGGNYIYWCVSPGFSAATGTWPSITPDVDTNVDIYRNVSGTMTLHAASQTVNWWYKDASTAGKLMAVMPAVGGEWDAILDSCTAI